MNRRTFFKAGGLLGATLTFTDAVQAAVPTASAFTSLSYNILACRGFPDTETNKQKLSRAKDRMTERLALEIDLYRPDLVTFQESPDEAVVARIASELGFHHAWFAGGWPGNEEWPGGFPGSILSRFPIIKKTNRPNIGEQHPEELFTRHWCSAVLETDNGPLHVFSAHLHPEDEAIRAREVEGILAVLEGALATGESLLFQGDLNHTPDGPEYARWRAAGLVDTLATMGYKDTPTFSSIAPKARIDYIWAGGPVASKLVESRVLFEGAFRTNPEDSTSFALSDHVPVLARFGE
jgi:endonuclease/exonuclease/phosphatase family metal-dependent hydrolase